MGQKVRFIFEVKIDRAVGNTGLAGDLGDSRPMKALFGEYFNRCIQYPVILGI